MGGGGGGTFTSPCNVQCAPTGNNQIISILIKSEEYKYLLVGFNEERIQTFYPVTKLNQDLFYRLIVFNIVFIIDGMVNAFQLCSEQGFKPTWIKENKLLELNPTKTVTFIQGDLVRTWAHRAHLNNNSF